MFLLVPAHLGSLGQRAVKRLLLLLQFLSLFATCLVLHCKMCVLVYCECRKAPVTNAAAFEPPDAYFKYVLNIVWTLVSNKIKIIKFRL